MYSIAVLQHKYQINIDGTVAAYRLPYLLVGDSVILKQDSIYYEHFYNELQPWKHYIPVKSNLSDLLEKLKWAKDHDEEVRSVPWKVYLHCVRYHWYIYTDSQIQKQEAACPGVVQ